MRLIALAALTAGAAVLVGMPTVSVQAESPLIVHTDKGDVRGVRADGVDSFLGVPYAAPPTGALRWQPPMPHASWSGVRDATHYGARCAALTSTNGARSNSENCLYVNIDRPAGTTSDSRLPVYVFIHGGGFVNGSSNQAGGAQFTRQTNAIVVSMNYRLGVFGFLSLPGLSAEGEGNYGFLDQQAALTWVQRNITAFGGDSSAVTLGGESAGAFSVCGHLVAAGSRCLFARAMMQSGACPTRPLGETRDASADVEDAAGCTTITCLRAKPAADLLDAGASFGPALTSGTDVFPQPLDDSIAAGDFTRVPMVVGANRDEGRTFVADLIGDTEAQYRDFLTDNFGANADTVYAQYPWPATSNRFTAAYLAGAVVTDDGLASGIGGCSALANDQQFARYVPTYAYEFAARYGPGLRPIRGYVWGAGHAAELAYLFPSFDNGTPIAPTFNAAERQLSRDMTQYWGAFVFTGSPQAQGRAAWPRFDDTSQFLSLRPGGASRALSLASYRAEHRCDFWADLNG